MFSYLGRQKGARWEFYRVLTGAKLFLGHCEMEVVKSFRLSIPSLSSRDGTSHCDIQRQLAAIVMFEMAECRHVSVLSTLERSQNNL